LALRLALKSELRWTVTNRKALLRLKG
jgi:hypothetical protein